MHEITFKLNFQCQLNALPYLTQDMLRHPGNVNINPGSVNIRSGLHTIQQAIESLSLQSKFQLNFSHQLQLQVGNPVGLAWASAF